MADDIFSLDWLKQTFFVKRRCWSVITILQSNKGGNLSVNGVYFSVYVVLLCGNRWEHGPYQEDRWELPPQSWPRAYFVFLGCRGYALEWIRTTGSKTTVKLGGIFSQEVGLTAWGEVDTVACDRVRLAHFVTGLGLRATRYSLEVSMKRTHCHRNIL